MINTQSQSGQASTAIVQGGFGRYFMVKHEQGIVRATRAFSCLVMPEPGDQVAVQQVDGQHWYILAILERSQNADTRLMFQGDVTLSTDNGKLDLRAAEGIHLSSAEEIGVVGKTLDMTAAETRIQSVDLTMTGQRLTSQWKEVRSISEAWHLVVDTLTETAKNAFRKVEGTHHQACRNHLEQVDETLSMRSKHAVITSRKDMKIDGERIHMG